MLMMMMISGDKDWPANTFGLRLKMLYCGCHLKEESFPFVLK